MVSLTGGQFLERECGLALAKPTRVLKECGEKKFCAPACRQTGKNGVVKENKNTFDNISKIKTSAQGGCFWNYRIN
jgi:hypothetical protein